MEVENPYELMDRERMNKIQSMMSAGKLDVNKRNQEGNTILHEAIIRREPKELINILIQAGADVNLKNNNNRTALQLFLESNLQDKNKVNYNNLLKMFLNAGADVNSQSLNSKLTPLHIAVIDSDLDSIKYLLNQGADPRVKCAGGRTPLHYAVRYYRGDTAIIETILSADHEVSKIGDSDGNTALDVLVVMKHKKVSVGVPGIVKCLEAFKKSNPDLNAEDSIGVRPVDLAIKASCVRNDFDTLEAFLQLGLIEVNGRCNLYGIKVYPQPIPILFAACDENSLSLVKYLLKKGADVNTLNDDRVSLLQYAIKCSAGESEYIDLINYLFKWNPILDTIDIDGENILDVTSSYPEGNPVLRSVLKRLTKLHFMGPGPTRRVTENMDEFLHRLGHEYEDIRRYYLECSREIEQIMIDKLQFRDLTFWHLLIDNKEKILFYFKNMNLVKFLKDIDIPVRYPIYGPEIQEKIDKALKKLDDYKKSAEVLSSCFPRHYNLGDLVVNKIVNYCKTKELRLLCD